MNNYFDFSRFARLYKHQLLLNSRLILFGTLGYCGSIFIIMFLMHLSNEGSTINIKSFVPMMYVFVIGFGVLYNGYSFKSLRSKESSISFLLLPATLTEKFLLEFINRIVLSFIFLPILFWFTFNTIGVFFDVIDEINYEFISIVDLYDYSVEENRNFPIFRIITPLILLIYIVPFTGATIFGKQPLIKTLFTVTILVFSYAGLIYFLAEVIGLNNYVIHENNIFFPEGKEPAVLFFEIVLWLSNLIFISVAYLKIKEKEV